MVCGNTSSLSCHDSFLANLCYCKLHGNTSVREEINMNWGHLLLLNASALIIATFVIVYFFLKDFLKK